MERTMTKYYKILDNDGKSCHGGTTAWSLPTKNEDGTWTPGEWMPEIGGELIPCNNGYHLCRPQDLLSWLHEACYEAEIGSEMVEDENKIVVRQVRLLRRVEGYNERTLRLFAVWCARQALSLVEIPDPRSVAACDVAEKYANGVANEAELAAAGAAVGDAARDAARAAARAAAWAAAWAAAGDAARAAAWAADAGDAAAGDAAGDAAWAAQSAKLLELIGEA
jgi:hypothetical protein